MRYAYRSQTRLESLVEACINTATGFAVSYATWIWVAGPLFDIDIGYGGTFWLTCIFTVVSILRQYVWRRFFNHRLRLR